MNPFTDDVFSGSLRAEPTLPELYQRESDRLLEMIGAVGRGHPRSRRSRQGRLTLLASPAAGAGKSHLLARLRSEHAQTAVFCPLDLHDSEGLRWTHFLEQILTNLQATREAEGSRNILTGRVAFLLGSATGRLVSEGKIPSQSSATTGSWLRENSQRLFDSSTNTHPAATWFHEKFAVLLLPELAKCYAEDLQLDETALKSWIEYFYRYARLTSDHTSPAQLERAQAEFLHGGELLKPHGEEAARSTVRMVGQLMSLEYPLVLVLDDLDWIYRDEAAALRLARILVDFGKLVPNSLAIVSLNRDIWSETFQSGLPEATRDRLTAQECLLEGVPRSIWGKFLRVRASLPSSDAVEAGVAPTNTNTNTNTDTATGADPRSGSLEKIVDSLIESHPTATVMMPRRLIRTASKMWRSASEEHAPEVMSEPRPEGSVASSEAPPPAPEATGEGTARLWSDAMGDLRNLIQTRSKEPSPAAPKDLAPAPLTPPEKVPSPILTPEFQSFISGIREDVSSVGAPPRTEDPETQTESKTGGVSAMGEASETAPSPPEHRDQTAATSTSLEPIPSPEWVAARLRKIRVESAKSPAQIDLEILRRLVSSAGKSFPAIIQEDVAEWSADLRWRFQQSEINFSFRPYADTEHWRKLLAENAERARALRESDRTRVKLAVFGRRAEENFFGAWNASREDTNNLQFCDAILLTDHQWSSVSAVGQLLAEENDPDRHAAVFTHASGELDFLWKMITRPVWTLVSQINRAAV